MDSYKLLGEIRGLSKLLGFGFCEKELYADMHNSQDEYFTLDIEVKPHVIIITSVMTTFEKQFGDNAIIDKKSHEICENHSFEVFADWLINETEFFINHHKNGRPLLKPFKQLRKEFTPVLEALRKYYPKRVDDYLNYKLIIQPFHVRNRDDLKDWKQLRKAGGVPSGSRQNIIVGFGFGRILR